MAEPDRIRPGEDEVPDPPLDQDPLDQDPLDQARRDATEDAASGIDAHPDAGGAAAAASGRDDVGPHTGLPG